jgi:mono/diheme cytochrome c family protein
MSLSTKRGTNVHRTLGAIAGAAITAVVSITAGLSTVVLAQSDAQIKAGLTVWRNSGCSDCHGAFANGEKERDESPSGADLRRAKLSIDELKLAIRCGRPGTGMPSFEEGARGCDGATGNLYPAPRKLSPEEIDSVAIYLQTRIVGHGRITKQECLYYYDNDESWCEDYR